MYYTGIPCPVSLNQTETLPFVGSLAENTYDAPQGNALKPSLCLSIYGGDIFDSSSRQVATCVAGRENGKPEERKSKEWATKKEKVRDELSREK
jgi:hypothetical protein